MKSLIIQPARNDAERKPGKVKTTNTVMAEKSWVGKLFLRIKERIKKDPRRNPMMGEVLKKRKGWRLSYKLCN
jgi:hypothetical protein